MSKHSTAPLYRAVFHQISGRHDQSSPQGFLHGVILVALPVLFLVVMLVSFAASAMGGMLVSSTFETLDETALSKQKQFTLTVGKKKIGAGDGSITSADGLINCGTTCRQRYDAGTSVTLTATPAENSSFAGWSGACSGTGACTVAMDKTKSVKAAFAAYKLKIIKTGKKQGTGNVTSIPAGIDCGATCQNIYPSGTTVTLSAVPDSGSSFTGWTPKSLCSGTDPCTVTMNTARTVTATFSGSPTSGTDTVPPSVPGLLSFSWTGRTQVKLYWYESTDTGGSGLAGYIIYRNGIRIATTDSTTYSDTGLSPDKVYTYTASAYDNASNESEKTTPVRVMGGLLAHYSFDEDFGNIASSGTAMIHDGLITAASRVEGRIGNGLRINLENSCVTEWYFNSYAFGEGLITIEAWIKPDRIEAGEIYRIIGSSYIDGFIFQIRDGRLEVLHDGQSYHYGAGMIAPNVWTHIAYVSDGRDIITYINGVEDTRTNITLPIQWMDWIIGANSDCNDGSSAEGFPGIMDEIRIWSVARSQSEIVANTEKQLLTPQKVSLKNPVPEAFYNFDEVSGNIAEDISGNDNDGLITAASRVEGKIGNGLRFGQNNSYVSPNTWHSYYFGEGLITIEAWIKPDRIEAGEIYRIIGSSYIDGFIFQIRDGRLEVLHDGQSYHYGAGMIAPNVWTHIAYVSDGRDIITYINGVEDTRTNITLPIRFMNWVIGASVSGNIHAEEFPGIMDELRIWSGVQTSTEIQKYYDSTK